MEISCKVKKVIGILGICTFLVAGCAAPQKLEKKNGTEQNTENISIETKNNSEGAETQKDPDEIANNANAIPGNNQDEQKKDSEQNKEAIEDQEKIPKINYQEIKPYEAGHIMVVMYHGIMDNPPYHRTVENFKKDLQYMYDHGYRPISIRDYVDNNISVEPGYTPIVLTFDDGLPSTFSLVEEDGILKPAPNTAVAIMQEFAKEHPDFGDAATFYINGNNDPFSGAGTLKKRLKYLVDHGYDVSNHTYSHAHLADLDTEGVQEEIGKVDQMIKEELPQYTLDTFSYPFGERPVEELRYLIQKGTYEGKEYSYKMGLREGPSGPFIAPDHVGFTPYNVPRVRGSEGVDGDLWWYFQYYESHPSYRYISDGNPDRIAVPEKYGDNVDKDGLGDKELYLYQVEE